MFAELRFIKWHFLSFVFNISVSSLFLLPNLFIKPYCGSITYEESAGFEEEDHDGRRGLHYKANTFAVPPLFY